ncbi:SAM-dependent methyltransferase [Sphaerisporangium flaviroseum]
MGNEVISPADVGKHYDEQSPIGDELRDGQLHMWYWYDEDDGAPLTEAVHRISRKVTGTMGLRAGEHVLDAGCGPGATAVYLADTFGVQVTGITVSAFELKKAKSRAAAAGVSDMVRFQYGDYTELTYPDESFDAVLALESLQNAPDPRQVFKEFFRVLRPGGRVSFSDFSLESSSDPQRVAKFMASLKLHTLPTLAEWLDHARSAGFEIEEYTQCGPRVFGRKAKYLKAAMGRRQEVATKFGEDAVAGFSQSHLGFFAPRKHQIGYVIVSARKPRR